MQNQTVEQTEKAFLIKMIAHHEMAVQMSEELLQTAETPALIQFAKKIISAQTAEIAQMKKWVEIWF